MEKHTVCLLNDSFPPFIDGVANAVLNYATQIETSYGHALVVTPECPGADYSFYPFPVYTYPGLDIRKKIGYVAGNPFAPEIDYRVRQESPDILHCHCPAISAYLSRMLRHSLDVPLVMTYHTKFDIDIANALRSKLLQKEAISQLVSNISACDEVWVVSKGAGENLRSLGFQGDYIVMENGVDMPRRRASVEEIESATGGYDLPAGVPVFLFVGRMMWYKGIRIILDALAGLKNEDIPFRMVFIGAGGDEKEIKDYSSSLGLDGCCLFTGAIRDRAALQAWYSRADLFLFPSTFDTNGLVVREAAASDLASIMIKDSCASEGVTDGRNGFLIDENAEAMAAKLKQILSIPGTAERVGKCAGDELYSSWSDAVAKAAERYEIVIDRYRSGYYRRNNSVSEELFRSGGALMEKLGKLEEVKEQLLTQFYLPLTEKLHESRDQAVSQLLEAKAQAEGKIQDTKDMLQKMIDQKREAAEHKRSMLMNDLSSMWNEDDRYL